MSFFASIVSIVSILIIVSSVQYSERYTLCPIKIVNYQKSVIFAYDEMFMYIEDAASQN